MNILSEKAKELLASQLQEWDLAKNNFDQLKGVKSKDFAFNGYTLRVQFNPARIQSSAAKVDAKSIQERKCFLCPANLPSVQKGIPFGKEYQILVNPFPIFPEHFTIPTHEHTDQLILNKYGHMLDLAKEMDEYTIFYNGPKCGASAPDHLHFQAGNKGFLPIEKDIESMSKELIEEKRDIKVYAAKDGIRNFILMEAQDKSQLEEYFRLLYFRLEIKEGELEPMMNLVTWYEKDTWYSCVFPRKVHRPACFFAEGDANILISPASVDLGGVFITPLEKDFDKITAEDLTKILQEICISSPELDKIIVNLKTLS